MGKGRFPESFECVTGERLEYPIDLVLRERVILLRVNHEALKSYDELKFQCICAQAVNGPPCKNCPRSGTSFIAFAITIFVGSIEPSKTRYVAMLWVKCTFALGD